MSNQTVFYIYKPNHESAFAADVGIIDTAGIASIFFGLEPVIRSTEGVVRPRTLAHAIKELGYYASNKTSTQLQLYTPDGEVDPYILGQCLCRYMSHEGIDGIHPRFFRMTREALKNFVWVATSQFDVAQSAINELLRTTKFADTVGTWD
ncbi:hypothetical protein V757_01965 [Pelistega indica]|uniref:Uncharacterized protein n=1 Tax=Pelistega indica TaxID=1414851 RepID=V8G8G7_9BURK|nr:hypothetical protein V757_01965 [Pelistega indica]